MPFSSTADQSPSPDGVASSLCASRGLDLRTKLTLLVVGVVFFLVVSLVILGCQAINQTGETAQQVSRAALESQAKGQLLNVTVESAERRFLELERTMAETKWLADTVGRYFSRRTGYFRIGHVQGAADLTKMPLGHHTEGEREQASIHISKQVPLTRELHQHVRFTRVLDPLADAILEGESKTSAVYFVSDKEMIRYYPKGGLRLPSKIKLKTIFGHSNKMPFEDPKPQSFWTEVYRDVSGEKMITAASTVFQKDGQFEGVIAMDCLLSDVGEEIEKTSLVEGSYCFLIDAKGKSIALPEIAYEEIVGRSRLEGEYGVDMTSIGGQMDRVIQAMRNGDRGIQRISGDDTNRFIAYAPVGDLGWSLATVVSTETIYRDIASLEETLAEDVSALTFGRLIPVGLGILVAVSLVASYLAYRFTLPLRQLTKAASSIAAGNWDVQMPVDGAGEVGVLGKTLAQMTKRLKGLIGNLETRVSEQTNELRTALQKLEKTSEQLKHRANHDELTGLWNRRGFAEELESRIKKCPEHDPAYLMVLDLDRFKVVNDTCGHAEGDRLLYEVAHNIQECLGPDDMLARIGGDEFAVLLFNCCSSKATAIAEKILEKIQSYEFYSNAGMFKIGVSIGLVSIDNGDVDLFEAQQLADTACYAAKKAGRNRVHIVGTNDLVAEHRGEMRWVQRMYEAMDNDLFVLFGQQIQPLESGSDDEGFVEILLRLHDESRNQLILPAAFLPAAERFGMMHEIDLWVVSKLIESIRKNKVESNQPRRFFVNLSGESLGDQEFCQRLLTLMRDSELPSGTINFEVTETVVIRSMGVARELIRELRELGCEIALDDFGSGVSSLMYVKELRVDYLKIDGSFIQGIANDEVDNIFVKSVIDIAHLSGMKTVAEYVENDEVRKIVKTLGADYGQGYGIHCPEQLFLNGGLSVLAEADAAAAK